MPPHNYAFHTAIPLIENCLNKVLGPKVDTDWALLDFPAHSNVGDNAIWLGALRLLHNHFGRYPNFVTRHKAFPHGLQNCGTTRFIFLLGGGNFGDLWNGYWQNRVAILDHFADHHIIQLPQSIHFKDLHGKALKETRRAIASHRNFTLLLRDQASYQFALKHFECPTYLCPDMAFGLGQLSASQHPQHAMIALMRDDIEKMQGLSSCQIEMPDMPTFDWINFDKAPSLEHWLCRKLASTSRRMGRLGSRPMEYSFRRMANFHLKSGISILSKGNVAITDRLHGHIMCTLMNKPHVALDNSYGKIGNYIRAWPNDGITAMASSLSEAIDKAKAIRV